MSLTIVQREGIDFAAISDHVLYHTTAARLRYRDGDNDGARVELGLALARLNVLMREVCNDSPCDSADRSKGLIIIGRD